MPGPRGNQGVHTYVVWGALTGAVGVTTDGTTRSAADAAGATPLFG